MFKKIILILLFAFALAACSASGGEGTTSPTIELTVPSAADVEATTEPAGQPVGGGTEESASEGSALPIFIAQLQDAVSQQDYPQMQAMAHNPLAVGAWRSEWRMYDPATLAEEFQNGGLPAPREVIFTGLTDDEIVALIGQPPATMLGPDTNVAASLHSTGWGENGTDEAILIVVEEDGQYSWYAFLYTFGPFAGLETPSE